MCARDSRGHVDGGHVAPLVLVTGGARSGKSSYAQRLAEQYPPPRLYVATAVPFDEELKVRVERHKQERAGRGWVTWEESARLVEFFRELAEARSETSREGQSGSPFAPTEGLPSEPTSLSSSSFSSLLSCHAILVDCLTLWMSNLLWYRGELEEAEAVKLATELALALKAIRLPVMVVTNEVGLGLVPESSSARLYRDLLGRANQVLAREADAVVLMVSGIPVCVKGGDLIGTS